MSLPPAYESRAAHLRIQRGLEAAGVPEHMADWAAATALAEAPYAVPTEEGWRIACRRARVLAHNGKLEKPTEYGDGYPADGIGVPA